MSPIPQICTPPAVKRSGDSLAAPAAAGQVACTLLRLYRSARMSSNSAGTVGTAGDAKSSRTCWTSGTRAYRCTRYPAPDSNASRSPSSFSLPRWLLSSSSTTASTRNALSQTTKSATFRSKVLRAANDFAVSSALKLTCANTTKSGKACTSRLCIACSRSVISALGLSLSPVPLAFFFTPAIAPTIKSNTTKTPNKTSKFFIRSSSLVAGSLA